MRFGAEESRKILSVLWPARGFVSDRGERLVSAGEARVLVKQRAVSEPAGLRGVVVRALERYVGERKLQERRTEG